MAIEQEVREELWRRIRKGEISNAEAAAMYRHEIVVRLAKRLGLMYSRTVLEK